MRRRREQPWGFNVWPAFTDVLGGVVVVLIFLITIFVIGEVLIGREMTSKETVINQLSGIVQYMEDLIGAGEKERERLRRRIDTLEGELAAREQALAGLRGELAEARADRERSQEALAQAQAERQRLSGALAARQQAYQEVRESKEQTAEIAIDARLEVATLERRIAELTAQMERLNNALAGSREELAAAQGQLAAAHGQTRALRATLEEREAELARRAATIDSQANRIEELDRLIKSRLVERVEELEKYASDFFGRLRDVFANNPDIKIVGDRFVFQSEVLFPSGEAELSPAGRAGLDKFVEVYREVEPELPEDLPIIIEVQGHTDRVPVRADSEFRSNWELSTERALTVVNHLLDRGIPPERLAAVGMGQYHPIDPGDTPEAYRKNRRIELKITSR